MLLICVLLCFSTFLSFITYILFVYLTLINFVSDPFMCFVVCVFSFLYKRILCKSYPLPPYSELLHFSSFFLFIFANFHFSCNHLCFAVPVFFSFLDKRIPLVTSSLLTPNFFVFLCLFISPIFKFCCFCLCFVVSFFLIFLRDLIFFKCIYSSFSLPLFTHSLGSVDVMDMY